MSKVQTVGRYTNAPKITKNCDHAPSGKKAVATPPALRSPRVSVKRGR